MQRGRPRKPTALKLIEGNRNKKRLPEAEPMLPRAPDDILNPPAYQTKRGKAAWRRMAKIVHDMGVLTTADAPALERVCEAYAQVQQAQDALEARGGLTYEVTNGKDGFIIRPL